MIDLGGLSVGDVIGIIAAFVIGVPIITFFVYCDLTYDDR